MGQPGMMMKTTDKTTRTDKAHDFHERLELSVKYEPQINQFYKAYFPGVTAIVNANMSEQKNNGIDKKITMDLGGGKSDTITVEEKVREQDYGDILIETQSCYEYSTPGWIYTSRSDYLVYAIPTANKYYIFPTTLLRRAFTRNFDKWVVLYPPRYTATRIGDSNTKYHTQFICIPLTTIIESLNCEMLGATA